MRGFLAIALVPCALLGSGCALVTDGADTLVARSLGSLQDHAERKRNARWAEEAWNDVRAHGGLAHSEDHEAGFKEGFAEYLYSGGNGEPPPLPPARYRKLRYQTPEGYRAVEDWFAGYRHGASVAEEKGYRRWVIGPSALAPAGHPPTMLHPPAPAPAVPLIPPAVPLMPRADSEQPTTKAPIQLPDEPKQPVRIVPLKVLDESPPPATKVPIKGAGPEPRAEEAPGPRLIILGVESETPATKREGEAPVEPASAARQEPRPLAGELPDGPELQPPGPGVETDPQKPAEGDHP